MFVVEEWSRVGRKFKLVAAFVDADTAIGFCEDGFSVDTNMIEDKGLIHWRVIQPSNMGYYLENRIKASYVLIKEWHNKEEPQGLLDELDGVLCGYGYGTTGPEETLGMIKDIVRRELNKRGKK